MRVRRVRDVLLIVAWVVLPGSGTVAQTPGPSGSEARVKVNAEARRPEGDADLAFLLRNMVVDHRYSPAEVEAATGLSAAEYEAAARRLGVRPGTRPEARRAGEPLRIRPYPGGRHPRIGFLDGAIDPQRETKVSVFAPWDDSSYVVVDVPEAVWSNLELIYLAHTHVPTVWTRSGVSLPRQEWTRRADGSLSAERRLPNGIAFRVKVVPKPDSVRMAMTLTNGTEKPLSDLRVQQCVMLKRAKGFEAQTNDNKVFQPPYAACRADDGRRWVITSWTDCQRAWGNPPCPCLHSDPIFPDCAPGETREVRGWLSFYEGTDLPGEIRRIDRMRWQDQAL